MLPEVSNNDLDKLAKQYFADELGLAPDAVSDAAANLTGAFEVLLRIEERLKKSQTPQPL